jgi:hypothetical protein
MLPPHDAELVLAFARECDDSIRAALADTVKMIPDALTDSRQLCLSEIKHAGW